MQDQIEALLHGSPITGLAVAFIEDGQPSTLRYFGHVDGACVEANSVWPVASLTKPLFVYGSLLLVQRGLLNLDRPLHDYLLKPYLNDVHLAHITARHAMSHTTGLPNWRSADGLRVGFAPGTAFSYSSEGLNYLQHVVEHITRQPLSEFLQREVFLPLGMSASVLQSEALDQMPPSLQFLSGSLLANGALSLRTTLSDYARFVSVMFEDAKRTSLVTHRWRDSMLTPQVAVGDISDLYWGLGWGLQHTPEAFTFWHWGARGAPRTMNLVLGIPETRRAVVIFTNHADGLAFCRQLIEAVFQLHELPAFDWLLPADHWRADGRRRGS